MFPRRGVSKLSRGNKELVARIRKIHRESGRTYGSPGINQALHQQRIRCSKKRIARLMKVNGILSKARQKFKMAINSDPKRPIANNVIERDFRTAPNKACASDITYI
jgi:putative transposase